MPPTPDKIPDKVPFDVYAMLVILTFLATGGATLLLNDRLSSEWQFWEDKAKIKEKAVHLTQMNPEPAKYKEGSSPRFIPSEYQPCAIAIFVALAASSWRRQRL